MILRTRTDRPTASAHAEGDAADLRQVVCLGQDREAGGVQEGDPIQVHDHARAGPPAERSAGPIEALER